ncbi:MAG: 3'(2'),5'-bisphosphate nucleotidase CysQ, partial [Nanoarchaeota archaeon]
MKYEKELSTAIELAQRAGELVMKYHDSENIGIETKPDNTPVTLADKASNKLILEGLRKEFPLDGIVSEEMEKIEGKRIWYIDPIDGTKGFIRKNGDFAVHIGLVEDKNPVLGVVYKPLTNEYFYGVKDFGAYKVENEVVKKLKISEEKTELRLIVSHNYDERDESKELVAKLNPSEIIKSGSEGLRLMKIVENIGDLRVTENANMCNTWDV